MSPTQLAAHLAKAREYWDAVLEEKCNLIAQAAGVERDRLVKVNPVDFVERMSECYIPGYKYRSIADFVRETKTPDTFLIGPIDEVEETAAQINYKAVGVDRKVRAHNCQVVPIPQAAALAFFVKNHRQSPPQMRETCICYALVLKGEIVAVMTYDLTAGATRGHGKAAKYELVRLSIKKGTQVNGGASKLQAACEEAVLHFGCSEIFSYSNATINEGGVYKQLGFTQGKIDPGAAYVLARDFSLKRLSGYIEVGAKNVDLIKRGEVKVLFYANRVWEKRLNTK